MSTPTTLAELLQLLDHGIPLLVPTARSARELRYAFDQHQRSRNVAAWAPPVVLTWQQWATGLWQNLILAGHETRLLLNPTQEHTLWREVISATPTTTLTSPDALAELARSAFALAAVYNALPRLRSAASTPDTRTFAAWADDFVRLCTTRTCLASIQLDHALLHHLESNTLPAPAALHLVDYTLPTPAQTTLLEAFRAQGTELHHYTLIASESAAHELHHLTAPTPHDELLAAARIARQLLEANPASRIALLVPGLTELAPAIEPVLRDILAPELHSIAADLSSTPWEIAPSTPLATLPILSTALDLARLATSSLPLERVSALLLSPYLGESSPEITEAIASFDTRILRQNTPLRPELDLPGLLALLDSPRARNLPHASALPLWPSHAFATVQRATLTRPRSFADWTEFLRDLLRSANWPGPRPPTALEAAAARAWDDALDLIATLDFTGRHVPYATALDALTRQLQTSVFTPPATHAPVQVLTPADAAGCLFDAVLFLHCTDANWPASERPHPLLPWSLQRSLAMPGTDPARSAALAHEFTTALIARTPTVLFLSAAADADGELRPSPLLAALHIPSSTTSPEPTPPDPIALETIVDDAPLPALPSTYVRGGARVLQLQAACGFRAFAELRLAATEPESTTLGLDARESGNRLHEVLQIFWNNISSQDELRRLTTAQRDQHLRSAIDEALHHHMRLHGPWDEAYIAVQKQRLFTLLSQWLQIELERSPFTVLRNEGAEEITVGPLTLSVRVDRIDQVAGGVLFVDYKTGLSPHPKAWAEDRPDEPQLPLYASFLPQPEELRGLAFAKVRSGSDMKILGVQSEAGILPASRTNEVIDMPLRVEDWRQVLTILAYDFAEGRAYVRPKSFAINCAHCGQRLLCRLDPVTLLATSGDDDDAPSEANDV
jgi:probable DNA repair protein